VPTWYAAALGEAVKAGPLAAAAVTVVVLLLVGAALWSFLRRSRARGVAALAVDQLEAPRLPEPPEPRVLAAEATEVEAAVSDEVEEVGPLDPRGEAT